MVTIEFRPYNNEITLLYPVSTLLAELRGANEETMLYLESIRKGKGPENYSSGLSNTAQPFGGGYASLL